MNDLYKELDKLFAKVNATISMNDFESVDSLQKLKTVCDSSSEMSSIFEFESYSYSMTYSNKTAYEYLGVTEEETTKFGFKYILSIMHPENMTAMYNLIKFFSDKENARKMYSGVFYIKVKKGWEWTYSCLKPAIYNKDGSVRYLLATGCSIDDLLKSKSDYKNFKNNLPFFEQHAAKYLSLTDREKDVLRLIAEEHTSKEIAAILYISPLTVDTYRKNLIEKLQVKSSIGLAKYAMLFNLR